METAPEGLITCLFTDIESSTQWSQGLHPDVWKQVAAEHDRILTECITAHGGQPERTEGDSFFATFPTAKAALECAVSIQQSLHENGRPRLTVTKNGEELPLRVRIGVYRVTQEVYRTEQRAYRDHQVSLAQRTMDCGVGGMIVANAGAYEAALPYISQPWRVWNNRLVKDILTPQTLYELLWDGDDSRRIRAPLWVPNWLRRPEDTFIGRTTYLTAIDRELKSGHRLVLLHGEGGIGKTRLAMQSAQQMDAHFDGRIFDVGFDGLTVHDPNSVTSAQIVHGIAQAFSAPQTLFAGIKPTGYAQSLALYLNHHFFDQPFLLILDNFENANNAATRKLLGDLLKDVAALRLLITCRNYFSLTPYSHALEIDGLSYPMSPDDILENCEAYQLFRDRALICEPPPDLSDSASIVSLLKATEGSALGIELAATRLGIPFMSTHKLAARLAESRMQWQRTDPNDTRTGPERHESIEACIDWSYKLLPAEEQTLYPRLSIFPKDFSLEAAQEICGISETILARWIRFHLLSEIAGRCQLTPVLREFAATRLPISVTSELTARFVSYFLAVLQNNQNMNQPAERNRIHTEIRNLCTLVDYLSTDPCTPELAAILRSLGTVLLHVGSGSHVENVHKAIVCYTTALKFYKEDAFPTEWAQIQNNLGLAYADPSSGDQRQNIYKSIACYAEALRIYQEQTYPLEWAMTQNNLGLAYNSLLAEDRTQNLQNAITCYQAALQIYTEHEYPEDWAMSQNNLGNAYADLSELTQSDSGQYLDMAIASYRATLKIYTQEAFPMMWAKTQSNLGTAYSSLPVGDRLHNLRMAIACYQVALTVVTQKERRSDWALVQNNLGYAYAELARQSVEHRTEFLHKAVSYYEAALMIFTKDIFPAYWHMVQDALEQARKLLQQDIQV